MDPSTEDLKFLGFPGILSHSFKSIFTWKSIFAQITLTSILPLAFTFIAHMHISNRFFSHIEPSPFHLLTGAFTTYKSYYNSTLTTSPADWLNYVLFKSLAIALITVFSILSTATVAYTITSIYSNRDVRFRNSIKVVPKVWKRLTVTFVCMLVTLLAYSLLTSVVIFIVNVVFEFPATIGLSTLVVTIVYVYGFLYLITVWQLANVVTVLEGSCGVKSMVKSGDLMYGKRKSALTVSYLLYQVLACVVYVYMAFVVDDDSKVWVWRVVIGVVCGVVLVVVLVVMMVSETVLYLVCKSYHREAVDLVSLTTFLSAYLGDSRPVFRTGEDIQLGRPQINQAVSQA